VPLPLLGPRAPSAHAFAVPGSARVGLGGAEAVPQKPPGDTTDSCPLADGVLRSAAPRYRA